MAGLGLDLTPLRVNRDYRSLYLASLVSLVGSFVTMVAAPLQIKQLTGSYVAVGLVGLAEFVPLVTVGLWGGAVADAHDRRRVVLLTEAGALAMSVGLAGNALLPHPQLWVIYAAAAGSAAATAMQRPSLDAMQARLVAHDQQSAATALVTLQHNTGAILAPGLGGLLAVASLPLAYGVDIASFLVSLVLVSRVAPMPPRAEGATVGLAAVAAGIRYAVGRRVLLGTYLADIVAMAFAMPEALYPFLADQLHAPHLLGLLYSAPAVGGVLATLTSGWTGGVHRHGVAIAAAAAGWGAAMALAGIAPNLVAMLGCLALAGAADTVSGIFRGTVWNQTIPDEMRGRLAGIELLSYSSGPTLGSARAGVMARLGGARFSLGVGGLLCIAGVGVVAASLPALLRYDDRTDPHASAERERRIAAADR